MRMAFVIACVTLLSVASAADAADCVKDSYGNVVCGRGQCATDQFGNVFCEFEGGGAVRDRYGAVRCGIGNCATDDLGQVKCSTKPGGGATSDSNGKVKCLDGCADGTPELCAAQR